ncbi:unnamed protein product [Kluyveromyces dobzhanskii CBS 2104]|uniref:WGS project CCBQ000000000 data, contig 00012 n=1 Tax=Kluyveromyces dobzhanskii CBS 2104 TaxID=1427455 RepID=A0A0A8L173_9SACH|nr:unnamed protein product [Kluyveromyces dobzhanskii CBS 2104]
MGSESRELAEEKVDGRYVCPHPDCDKTFSRYEHLQRHKLNHWPKQIFQCEYVYPEDGITCNRTFVRKDLLVRHQRRHTSNGIRMQMKVRRESGKEKVEDGSTPAAGQVQGMAVSSGLKSGNVESQHAKKVDHIVLDVGDRKNKMGHDGVSLNNSSTTTSSSNASLNSGFNAMGNAPSANLNNFFNWLFAGGTNPDLTPLTATPNQNIGVDNDTVLGQPPGVVPGAKLEDPSMLGLPQQQNQVNPHAVASTPLDSKSYVAPQSNTYEVDATASMNAGVGAGATNIMDDLFSVDFLPTDPLQSLVQQMSYKDIVSPAKTSETVDTPSNTGSGTSPNGSIPNRSPKFKDIGKENVKDNLLAQKSKVGELKSQLKRSEKLLRGGSNSHRHSKKQKTMLLSKPSFFNSDPNSKFKLSLEGQNALALLIADIKYILLQKLQTALKSYWLNFHPQYPILHKPSFDIEKAPPILVLSMIMTGASYLGSENRNTVSDVIAGPLRWLIFSHEDFQPTSETYIIQALLLLECYEKTSTNRYLHERSYLHHGTTIQLLRRTPSLGGHPLRVKKEHSPSDYESMEETYKNWIDFETLKRTALYAFYIDTTHAVVFGYTYLFIHCNQVRLSLPCSDEIWDSYDLSLEKLLQHGFGGKDVSFLDTLKQLLNDVMHQLRRSNSVNSWTNLKSSKFGEKLLLSGLISIMFQLQQHSEVISLGVDNPLSVQNIHWQEIISFAIDYWHKEIMHGCKNSSNSVLSNVDTADDEGIKLLRLDDNYSCKIPAYHMTQIILRIFQYDYYIYAGAPWRMNVRAGTEEYALVSERVLKFSQDPMQGGMAIIYAYMFLFEMFRNGDDFSCDVNLDYCITRPNTLALTSLLIWSYNYSLYGPETLVWDNTKDANDNTNEKVKSEYIPAESFKQHLKKMYRYLKVDESLDVFTHHQQLKEKARLLTNIPNTNHLAGMMLFMRDLFHGCYWELGREFSNLFDNCFERSIGREKAVCEHMYET